MNDEIIHWSIESKFIIKLVYGRIRLCNIFLAGKNNRNFCILTYICLLTFIILINREIIIFGTYKNNYRNSFFNWDFNLKTL